MQHLVETSSLMAAGDTVVTPQERHVIAAESCAAYSAPILDRFLTPRGGLESAAEERQDIMGAGNVLQVIKRGNKVVHDDFAPFEAIAKTWGDERLSGAMAKCNTWSPA